MARAGRASLPYSIVLQLPAQPHRLGGIGLGRQGDGGATVWALAAMRSAMVRRTLVMGSTAPGEVEVEVEVEV